MRSPSTLQPKEMKRMSKETKPKRPDIPLTQKAITVELWEIYEEIVLGLAELPRGDDNGRRRIAGATERIGNLLGLDKITKKD